MDSGRSPEHHNYDTEPPAICLTDPPEEEDLLAEEEGRWTQEPQLGIWMLHSTGKGMPTTEMELQALLNSDIQPSYTLSSIGEIDPKKAACVIWAEIDTNFANALGHVREARDLWPDDELFCQGDLQIITSLRENPPPPPGQSGKEKKKFWQRLPFTKKKEKKPKEEEGEGLTENKESNVDEEGGETVTKEKEKKKNGWKFSLSPGNKSKDKGGSIVDGVKEIAASMVSPRMRGLSIDSNTGKLEDDSDGEAAESPAPTDRKKDKETLKREEKEKKEREKQEKKRKEAEKKKKEKDEKKDKKSDKSGRLSPRPQDSSALVDSDGENSEPS